MIDLPEPDWDGIIALAEAHEGDYDDDEAGEFSEEEAGEFSEEEEDE